MNRVEELVPLDEYVEISGKLRQIMYNSHNKDKLVKLVDDNYIIHDPIRDITLDKATAMDKYPEYFV